MKEKKIKKLQNDIGELESLLLINEKEHAILLSKIRKKNKELRQYVDLNDTSLMNPVNKILRKFKKI